MDTYTPMRAMIVCANGTGDYIKKEDAIKALQNIFKEDSSKIIEAFLDIDGVLNSNDWYVKTRGIGGYNGGDVDPKCIELINDLIDATGAKIIMSSSWRSDYENSCEYLYDNGLYCDAIIGKTPHFCYTCQNDDIRSTLCRGNEIQYVLESKDITGYVIFDDDQDMLYSQKDNFIHIDYMHGITKEHIEQAIKILNK